MSIFDLVQSAEIAAYWEVIAAGLEPYFAEELFPMQKRRGLDLKWIKGSKGLTPTLKISAFDAKAVPRGRIGFDKVSAEMPFFKESKYIDEELRQELNMVLQTGNQAYIDSVMQSVFDDEVELIKAAAVARERMRMQLITSGIIVLAANGQAMTYDYNLNPEHKVTTSTSWSNTAADIIGDIQKGIDKILDDTGETVTRAVCNSVVWRQIKNNKEIKDTILTRTNGAGRVSDANLKEYLLDELKLQIAINDKKYKDEAGVAQKFMPDATFVLLPDGDLGTTWFGTTPEESDLMTSGVANVSIVDGGVAVTTIEKADPVNVETKVTQICLPSFEQCDKIYIIDTEA